jgi:hypothetical protein
LARAKNTQRSNARRRYREQVRVNELSDGVDANELDDGPDSTEPVSAPAPGGIASMFSRPNIREDIRALPGMFRAKRILWLPFAILIVAAALVGSFEAKLLPVDSATIVGLLAQLVLAPSALFVPFIAGFLAPRASYMIGFLVGLLQAILVTLLSVLSPAGVVPTSSTTTTAAVTDPLASLTVTFIVCLVFGTVAAAFASWYRNFLRNSQQRAQANRMVREKAAREKAKEREREQRVAERESRKGAPRKAAP